MRRLVVSLMLAAVAALVLHGGAAARLQRPGSEGLCTAHALVGQIHHAATHHYAPAPHGDHSATAASSDSTAANLAHGTSGAHRPDQGLHAPCCDGVCAAALTIASAGGISVPLTVGATLVPESQRGAGIHSDGPMRPPRSTALT